MAMVNEEILKSVLALFEILGWTSITIVYDSNHAKGKITFRYLSF